MFNYSAFSCTYYSLWSNNQVKDNLFRLGAQLIYLIKLLIPAPITFCGVIST